MENDMKRNEWNFLRSRAVKVTVVLFSRNLKWKSKLCGNTVIIELKCAMCGYGVSENANLLADNY